MAKTNWEKSNRHKARWSEVQKIKISAAADHFDPAKHPRRMRALKARRMTNLGK